MPAKVKSKRKHTTYSRATLTIHDAQGMSKQLRTMIAEWLRRQARELEMSSDMYAARFRARYNMLRK